MKAGKSCLTAHLLLEDARKIMKPACIKMSWDRRTELEHGNSLTSTNNAKSQPKVHQDSLDAAQLPEQISSFLDKRRQSKTIDRWLRPPTMGPLTAQQIACLRALERDTNATMRGRVLHPLI